MQVLSNAVGPGQPNTRHDAALVQAALRLIPAANGRSFLGGQIDGSYGRQTQGAIDAFQTAHGGDAVPIRAGVVTPGGATVQAMERLLPQNRRDLRCLAGQRIVYLGQSATQAANTARALRANADLEGAFRARVADLVTRMQRVHGIAMSLTPSGARRSFADQAALGPPQSYAGPGESNHNFGRAVDIGFNGLQWLRRNAQVATDNHWLGTLEGVEASAAGAFWDARDAIALVAPVSLFRLRFERIHLQSYDQSTASSGRSLARLLTAVGAFDWRAARYARAQRDWHYSSDLGGAAGVFVEVGTANQIWAGNATVTAAEIRSTGWASPGAAGPPATIGAAEIAQVRAALRADFASAETSWRRWTPVP